MSTPPVTGDSNLDHVVKVVCARFPLCCVTIDAETGICTPTLN